MTTIILGHGQNLDWPAGVLIGTFKNATTNRLNLTGGITISITYSGSALSDYQILVTVDTQTLISAGKMNSAGNDIRFYDSDGSTNLSYWIETGINTTTTKIWVKVPGITGNKSIYMRYGDSSLLAASNGANTFDFFDDFSTTKSGWTSNGGIWTTGSGVLALTSPANPSRYYRNIGAPPYIIRSKVKMSDASNWMGLLYRSDGTIYNSYWVNQQLNSVLVFQISGTTRNVNQATNLNTFYTYEVRDSGNEVKVYLDGVLKDTSSGTGNNTQVNVGFASWGTAGYFDDFLVRKYAATEPTVTTGEVWVSGTHSVIIDMGPGAATGTLSWSSIEDPNSPPLVEINTVKDASPRTISIRGSDTAPSGTQDGTFNDGDSISHPYWKSWGGTTPSGWEEVATGGTVSSTPYRYIEIRETLRYNL